jgi:hypothetical protein
MKITFDNIGGIKLVPYGGNTKKLYGLGSVTAVTPTGRGKLTATGVLVPGIRNTGYENSPLLTVDGNVFLDGAKVWDPTSESLVNGGWLGEVTTTLNIVYDDWDREDRHHIEESCSITTLGIIPYNQAPHGCIKVTNLSFPNIPNPFHQDYGTTLDWDYPYGDSVGEIWEAEDRSVQCCKLNRNNSFERWYALLTVANREWKNYGQCSQDNTYTVNFDGDLVPLTIGSASVEGVLFNEKRGGVGIYLSGRAGAF